MITSDRFNDYINTHTRESLRVIMIVLALLWQSVAAIFGLAIYVLYIRIIKGPQWLLLVTGLLLALAALSLQTSFVTVHEFLKHGFGYNFNFWKLLFEHGWCYVIAFIFYNEFFYITAFTLLIAGIFGVIDLITNNPHEKMMRALQEGNYSDGLIEVKNKVINKALDSLDDENYNGTVLGVSKYNGKYVVMPDRNINQVVLVLGTTGGGKTITLRRFYRRAIMRGFPLLVVDGKPDDVNIELLRNFAEQNRRPFFGFNCADKINYDPLANGGFTELKDKIICLKDKWENDYYRSIAEDYLQTIFQVILKSGIELDLKRVVECLTYKNLVVMTKSTGDRQLMERVAGLANYEIKDITGLQAHLNILIHSELGTYFEKNKRTFSLSDVIDQNGVAYFALPAYGFPVFPRY